MNFQHFARLDLAFSLLCLQHKFSRPVSKISRCISRTGDGHLYALLLAMGWWFGQSTQADSTETQFSQTGLWAYAFELPLYWLAKNSFKRIIINNQLIHPTDCVPPSLYSQIV